MDGKDTVGAGPTPSVLNHKAPVDVVSREEGHGLLRLQDGKSLEVGEAGASLSRTTSAGLIFPRFFPFLDEQWGKFGERPGASLHSDHHHGRA